MNSLKKPETIITLVNTAALLGISIYFYRKTNNLESELNKHSEHLTSTIKKVKEIANTKKYIAQIANAIKELNNYSAVANRDIESLKEIIKFQNSQIQELQTFILSLRPEDNKNDFKLKENPHIFAINPFHRGFPQAFPQQAFPQQGQNQMAQGQMGQQQMGQQQMAQFPQPMQGQLLQPSQMNQGQMNQGQMNQGQMNQGQQMRQLPNPQQFPGNQFAPPSPQPVVQQMNQFPGNMNAQQQQFPSQMNAQQQQFPSQMNAQQQQFPSQQFPGQMNTHQQFPGQMNTQQFPGQMNQFGQMNFPPQNNFGQQNFGQQGMFPGMDGNIDNEDDAIAAVQRAKQQQATDNVLDNLF